jgi:hypothetical protein
MAKITVDSDRKTHTTEFTPADTDRSVFLGNPQVDHLFTAVAVLGSEVWALRRRQRITEKLIQQNKGAVTIDMIEKYVPTPEENAAWGAERNDLVASIFQGFTRQADIPYASTLHPNHPKQPG